MKKILVCVAIVATAIGFASCGTNKSVTTTTPSYQQQLQSQQVAEQEQPKKVEYTNERAYEEQDPWYELQAQATDRLRGAGDAISTIKVTATQMAMSQAISNLVTSIENNTSTARRYVLQAMNLNDKAEASSEFSEDIKIKAQQLVGMNKPLMTKTYRLKNGHYQVGHCFEMIMTISELKKELAKMTTEDILKNVEGASEKDKEIIMENTQRALDMTNF